MDRPVAGRRTGPGLRAVARARPRGHPRLRRRPPAAHAERGRPRHRADPRRGPPVPADAGRAGLRPHRRPRCSRCGRASSSSGYAYLSGLSLPEVALPHLEALVAQVHESSSLSVLDGDDVVYVARVPTKRIMTVAISVGYALPRLRDVDGPRAARRAAGRVAGRLPRHGAAAAADPADDHRPGEAARGASRGCGRRASRSSTRSWRRGCARSPCRSAARTARVVAAVNVSAHASRGTSDAIRKPLLPPLQDAARRIEEDLRGGARRPGRPRAPLSVAHAGSPGQALPHPGTRRGDTITLRRTCRTRARQVNVGGCIVWQNGHSTCSAIRRRRGTSPRTAARPGRCGSSARRVPQQSTSASDSTSSSTDRGCAWSQMSQTVSGGVTTTSVIVAVVDLERPGAADLRVRRDLAAAAAADVRRPGSTSSRPPGPRPVGAPARRPRARAHTAASRPSSLPQGGERERLVADALEQHGDPVGLDAHHDARAPLAVRRRRR